jgi:coenzyme F420-reducing hydrogenase beta subunit
MISVLENKKCCGCSACADICPVGAIVMAADREGFLYPQVDAEKCTECGLCEKVCPAIELPKFNDSPEVYALQIKDEDVLTRSQSGGAFWAIAQGILEKEGVVYGAAFDENLRVVHCRAESMAEAQKFHGSKYVQTDMRGVMKQVKKDLKEGRQVLFTGTACHVAGLYKFLGKDYENLITCDLICHGAVSPLVLEKYFDTIRKEYNCDIDSFSFGYYDGVKNRTWNDSRKEKIVLTNGHSLDGEKYNQMFYSRWCMRPFCHSCPFTNTQRVTDFTIGDFWGVAKYTQTFNTDRGVSVLFANSPKGKELMPEIQERAVCEPANVEDVKKHNPNLNKPTIPNKRRSKIMQKFIKKGFMPAYKTDRFYDNLYCLKQKVLKR